MKSLLIKIAYTTLALTSFSSFASAIKAQTGKFCPGDQVTIKTSGSYVERMLISAEGIRNNGFIHVYADGVKVQRIGIPGYDPDYTFRIRRHVSEITLTFEQTCARILGNTVYTADSEQVGRSRYDRERALATSWGHEVLALIDEIDNSLVNEQLQIDPLYSNVLSPLKKAAMYERASETQRDNRSLIKIVRALKIAKIIRDNKTYMFNQLEFSEHEYFIFDLLCILEDILEHTDVKQNEIQEEINFISTILKQ